MTVEYHGTIIMAAIGKSEPREQVITITLPDGYSYEKLLIMTAKNMSFIHPFNGVPAISYTFPPINSHSPNVLKICPLSSTDECFMTFNIQKFGQIPDPHYFDGTYDAVLVPGDDGKEYKVIPSDQFK